MLLGGKGHGQGRQRVSGKHRRPCEKGSPGAGQGGLRERLTQKKRLMHGRFASSPWAGRYWAGRYWAWPCPEGGRAGPGSPCRSLRVPRCGRLGPFDPLACWALGRQRRGRTGQRTAGRAPRVPAGGRRAGRGCWRGNGQQLQRRYCANSPVGASAVQPPALFPPLCLPSGTDGGERRGNGPATSERRGWGVRGRAAGSSACALGM